MSIRILVVLFGVLLLSTGCEDNVDPVDDDDDVADDDDAADSYEGDEAGECSDGADNDQDGLFDCDDEGCAGSPDCAGDDDDDDDDSSDDDTGDDDTGDDDTGDDDTGDDDTGDDDTGDDDTGDDDTAPVDADGDGWDESVDCDDNDAALNLDDADGDGFSTCDGDCNDGNGAINPLATDVVGDGTDQNCDGMDGTDADGDGYAADWSGGDDCDDNDAAIYPGAAELCDGIDQACDGDLSDEADDDADGYRVCDGDCDDNDPLLEVADVDGDGVTTCDGDCDDTDAATYPGAADPCDGVDQDCAGDVGNEADADGDGSRLCDGDCNDADATVYPGAAELCDGIDNDCDGLSVDEVDDDGDAWMICAGDCDDTDAQTYPGAPELCDGIDNNCNGSISPDESDGDGDGYRGCDGDCDDTDFDVNPDAVEDCMDGIDNDCDGNVDGGQAGDSFVQAGNYTSDILFVVDNSCSMYEEQANLGVYFQNMYDVLDAEGIDFRIAVATTDTGDFQDNGGGVYVIDPSTPDPVLAFQTICDVGTTGSGVEQGLRYGLEAMQLAEAGTSPNTGFWREDAGLRVIFVSDEQDQSPAGWAALTQDYQALKTNPDHVILNAITGTDGVSAVACTGAGGSAGAGYGYVDAVQDTGGILSSICDFDWTVMMEDLGYVSEHLADTFELSQTPDPAYIQVFVNGVEVFTGWTYDSNINSVVFDPADVPADGDTVDIDYCL